MVASSQGEAPPDTEAPDSPESIAPGPQLKHKNALLVLLVVILLAVAIPPVRDGILAWCKDAIDWKPTPVPRGFSAEYVERINDLVDDLEHPKSRGNARERLEAMGRGILPILAPRLSDEPEPVRFEIATLLGRFKDTRGLAFLANSVLQDDNKRVRSRALWAIQRFEELDFALAHLRSALGSGVERVRYRAAIALAALEDDEGLEIIHEALDSPARALDAIEALISVHDDATSALLVRAFPNFGRVERQEAIQAFRKIGDSRSVTALIFALQDGDPGVRWRACHALRFTGDAVAILALEKLAEVEKDRMVLKHAAKAIEKLTARRERGRR